MSSSVCIFILSGGKKRKNSTEDVLANCAEDPRFKALDAAITEKCKNLTHEQIKLLFDNLELMVDKICREMMTPNLDGNSHHQH